MKVAPLALGLLLAGVAAAQYAQDAQVQTQSHVVPLVLAADSPAGQGFVRVANFSGRAGTVRIRAIDDAGSHFDPVDLALGANAAARFTSAELESGAAAAGLSGGVGDGQGDWWLEMQTDLDISPQAFARTPDGAVTALNGVETAAGDGRCYVPYFEPGTEWSSWLRLVNAGADDAEIDIEGLDDLGESAPGGNVGLTLPANRSRTLGAAALEAGAAGLRGRLGDGSGAWRLFVSSDRPIRVVNLRKTANGRLTALSECEETQRPDGTVFTDNMLGVLDKASDPYELIAARIAGDTLTATVAYGGGCESHEFTLLVSDAFMMSDPVRAADRHRAQTPTATPARHG